MEMYPQYRLEDFYIKHFYEGGLTLGQVKALYELGTQRKINEFKFQAMIHGIDLSKHSKNNPPPKQKDKEVIQSPFMFGNPEDYSHMSKEEKEELTQKMLNHHMQWAGGKLKGKPKNG